MFLRTRQHLTLKTVALLAVIVCSFASLGLNAQTVSAARYSCGDWCNGKRASQTPPDSTTACSADSQIIATNYPSYDDGKGGHFIDGNLRVNLMYSSHCQTVWLKMINRKSTPARVGCYASLSRMIPHKWVPQTTYPCPANNASQDDPMTTPMVNVVGRTQSQPAANASVQAQMKFSGKYYPATVSFNY